MTTELGESLKKKRFLSKPVKTCYTSSSYVWHLQCISKNDCTVELFVLENSSCQIIPRQKIWIKFGLDSIMHAVQNWPNWFFIFSLLLDITRTCMQYNDRTKFLVQQIDQCADFIALFFFYYIFFFLFLYSFISHIYMWHSYSDVLEFHELWDKKKWVKMLKCGL